ncbi:peroxiredoxin family protein [Novipirellula artificiosorum]|uniref:AhpC/TSA family protein n=1 Tax=Novipirellula artificiosorum TaxID=2528016 RepID=A0A5C6DYL1_9BACT|nr:redoxin domain-containing protein [Novipirellula artificiosorum]TWU40917.1 AhpC/TSA family protein [Novipirellula artificiosorum]
MLNVRLLVILCLFSLGTGCSRVPDDGIEFTEVTQSQPITIDDFSSLRFTDPEGAEVTLSDLMTRKYLVLVITRGWNNGVCFYCASQTSRWARRYDELEAYDAQLVAVFPVESDDEATHLTDLDQSIKKGPIENEQVPYPLLLDINLSGVDQLGIRAQLAKPSTYIVDREGRVRFAYVGESIADRPTVDSVLRQLDLLEE